METVLEMAKAPEVVYLTDFSAMFTLVLRDFHPWPYQSDDIGTQKTL